MTGPGPDGPRVILVTGMTSLRPFAMELENLGNFVIVEPFFRTLRRRFPEATIVTTLQLTESFARGANLRVVRDERLWGRSWKAVASAGTALLLAAARHLVGRLTGHRPAWLARLSPRLREIAGADMVLDFSGDMFGDNAHGWRHLFLGWTTPVLANLTDTPCYFVASSPGPFGTRLAAWAARNALPRYRIVSTREPISLELLRELGLRGDRYRSHACPSFGFQPLPATASFAAIAAREPALKPGPKPLVGLILADLNMATPPLYRWPRDDADFAPFVDLVRFMVRELGVRVCVMSHQNSTGPDFELRPGPDHRVVARLVEMVALEDAFTLRHLYDASAMHRLIGGLEALVSGRIHGAVQGLSQRIPTAIIDYHLPPGAHKLEGFARLAGVERYLCDPAAPIGMREGVGRLWAERVEVRAHLEKRVPALVDDSVSLWDEIHDDWQAWRAHSRKPLHEVALGSA